MKWLIAAAAAVTLAALLARRANAAAAASAPAWLPSWASGEPDQRTSLLEDMIVSIDPSTYAPVNVDTGTAARNVRAFLDMIAYAEGADYDTLFGGGTFDSFADHPRQYITRRLGGRDITSSAAGRYQFLARTWDGLADKLQLPDFGPASQDAGAVELIRERGALHDVQAGRFAMAIEKVRRVWASLPGAGYSQPEKSFADLVAVYQRAGGTLEQAA